MTDASEWFKSLPQFTRYWLLSTVGLTLLSRFGLVSYQHLILAYEPFINKFQIWRPVTALFYYPLSPNTGFQFLVNCYFLYNYSLRLERDVFGGRPADYLFMLLFNWICCVAICLFAHIPVIMDPMVMSILYIWCQLHPEVIVHFWFGTQFKATYLPWVLLGFNLIISGGGTVELFGIIVGHTYYFLAFKYPQEMGGPKLIKTPQILYDWFPNQRPIPVFGTIWKVLQSARAGETRRHNWGRGQFLRD